MVCRCFHLQFLITAPIPPNLVINKQQGQLKAQMSICYFEMCECIPLSLFHRQQFVELLETFLFH